MSTNKIYVCPVSKNPLKLTIIKEDEDGHILDGYYQNQDGQRFPIHDDIPKFNYPEQLTGLQKEQFEYYQTIAESYDNVQYLTFAIQNEDEEKIRHAMIQPLHLNKSSSVLEIACGTGQDSINISHELDQTGELYVQDISPAMLHQCRKKLANATVPVYYSSGSAAYLAFPDNYFDAVYSFGGLNIFDDKKLSLQEMVRVTKPGGRIVVGDESMPPWLHDTDFGKVLLNNNPLFKIELPLADIPVEARNVKVQWIIGGVYYLIDFTVGEGEPTANFNLKIPGERGGTLNTRYHGSVEGITTETKKLVQKAAKISGVSMHEWLDIALKNAANKDLED